MGSPGYEGTLLGYCRPDLAQFNKKGVHTLVRQLSNFKHSDSVVLQTL